jgi:hypothetical protein
MLLVASTQPDPFILSAILRQMGAAATNLLGYCAEAAKQLGDKLSQVKAEETKPVETPNL